MKKAHTAPTKQFSGSQSLYTAFFAQLIPIILSGQLDDLANQGHYDAFLTRLQQAVGDNHPIHWAKFKTFLEHNLNNSRRLQLLFAPILRHLVVEDIMQPLALPPLPPLPNDIQNSLKSVQEIRRAFKKTNPALRFLFEHAHQQLCNQASSAYDIQFPELHAIITHAKKDYEQKDPLRQNTLLRQRYIVSILEWYATKGFQAHKAYARHLSSPASAVEAYYLSHFFKVTLNIQHNKTHGLHQTLTPKVSLYQANTIPNTTLLEHLSPATIEALAYRGILSVPPQNGVRIVRKKLTKKAILPYLEGLTPELLESLIQLKNTGKAVDARQLDARLLNRLQHMLYFDLILPIQQHNPIYLFTDTSDEDFRLAMSALDDPETICELLINNTSIAPEVCLIQNNEGDWREPAANQNSEAIIREIPNTTVPQGGGMAPKRKKPKTDTNPYNQLLKAPKAPTDVENSATTHPSSSTSDLLNAPPKQEDRRAKLATQCLNQLLASRYRAHTSNQLDLKALRALLEISINNHDWPIDWNWMFILDEEYLSVLPPICRQFSDTYKDEIVEAMVQGVQRYVNATHASIKAFQEYYQPLLPANALDTLNSFIEHLSQCEIDPQSRSINHLAIIPFLEQPLVKRLAEHLPTIAQNSIDLLHAFLKYLQALDELSLILQKTANITHHHTPTITQPTIEL